MREKYFQLKNLSVGYNGEALIHDINIDVTKGEIITLIGPNGSGKSTILKSITKQLALIGGNVLLESKDLQNLSYKELSTKMAVVLTERMKGELMTCHDIVATGRYPYTGRLGLMTDEDESKVDEAMRQVQAHEIGDHYFNAISDGQRQRVLLARAICQEPDIIILDEPTSFLDIKHKLELLSILRSMAKSRGITVIMSMHEIDLAQKISDKIVCVKGEKIFRYGEPSTIFNSDLIHELYSIDNGYFDSLYGSVELPKPEGQPDVLVLSSCGSGIPIYRRLQREDTPFIAGILYTNDVDYRLASLLADEVIEEKPFREISDRAFDRTVSAIKNCNRVINAGVTIGDTNKRMRELIEIARDSGKMDVII